MFLPQMLGARDLPFPRLSAFGFWCLPAGWDIPLRLALLRCGAARRLVHVPAADLRVSTGDRRGHLAAGLLVHRGGRDCRRRGNDRRRAQNPPAGDAHQPHPALRLVRSGGRRDDSLRLPAAHRRQPAAGDRARLSLALLRSGRRRRPAAVAAPVLALRPPGGLHHFPAVGRPGGDDRADVSRARRSWAIPGSCWRRSAPAF